MIVLPTMDIDDNDNAINMSTFRNVSATIAPASYFNVAMFQFWAWGVTGNIVAVLGILGNILAIVVLAQPRMRSSTSVYLIAQAGFDIVVLVSMSLNMALPTIYVATRKLEGYYFFYPLIQPYAYPIALTAQMCSIYTTVAFTAERYVAVCYPLRAARWCTSQKARRALILIIVSSIVYNLPRWFEYYAEMIVDPSTNMTNPRTRLTSFGESHVYLHIYFIYMYIPFMLLIPFISLTFMNSMLIRAVRKSHRSQGRVVNTKQHKENNLTIMLIIVVAVFLMCQLPCIPDNIFQATLDKDTITEPVFVKLTCISSLMVITNSAVNFYLYCVFGNKFRRVFCHLFCWRSQCCASFAAFADGDTSVMLRNSSKSHHEHCQNGSQHSNRSNEKAGSASPRPIYRYTKPGLAGNDKTSHNSACSYTSIRRDRSSFETNV